MNGLIIFRINPITDMDADSWADYYERTKEEDGFPEAANSLVAGMNREMKSRAERAGMFRSAGQVVKEVDGLYREVARRFEELNNDGYAQLLEETQPEIAQLLD